MSIPLRVLYDCSKCTAWCCSYPNIFVNNRDLVRMGRVLKMDPHEVEKKYTDYSEFHKKRILKHKKDEFFGTTCRFLDSTTRRCTIYEGRPQGCRTYPGRRCTYYGFLEDERARQDDPTWVATTDHRDIDWQPS